MIYGFRSIFSGSQILLKAQAVNFKAGPKSSPWTKGQHQIQVILELFSPTKNLCPIRNHVYS